MTPTQKLELKRLTKHMWWILRYAAENAEIGNGLHSPLYRLQKRGFIILYKRPGGWFGIELTDAGREALMILSKVLD
jgi:hypothetical protein